MILLSTAYLGNIHYFSKLAGGERIVLDLQENYLKQSYRNRCDILGANGPLSLTVPVLKTHFEKVKTADIQIDYSKAWQHIHWMSIVSAYKSAPYFDHYEELLRPFYREKIELLATLNNRLQETLLKILNLTPPMTLAEHFSDNNNEQPLTCIDLRTSLSPKKRLQKEDHSFRNIPYYQVFSEKFDFVPNLSILDLLFNEGPRTSEMLRNSRNQ